MGRHFHKLHDYDPNQPAATPKVRTQTRRRAYPHIEQIEYSTHPAALLDVRIAKFVTAARFDLQRCNAVRNLAKMPVGVFMPAH